MKFRIILLTILILISTGCKAQIPVEIKSLMYLKKEDLTALELKSWYSKDLEKDTIVGVSLDRAYEEILNKRKGDTVIVALLDNRIDRWHEDIKEFIWINDKEIPENNIDDDNNGYADDINGWNFLGNANGENVDRATFETTRIVKKYQGIFDSIDKVDISKKLKSKFELYRKAKKLYDENIKLVKKRITSIESFQKRKNDVFNYLKNKYPDFLLTDENINKLKPIDSITKANIATYKYFLKYSDWAYNTYESQNRYLNIYLSLDYDERSLIGDDVDNINDTNYGNGNINASKTSTHNHSIKVAGILGAKRNNGIGINGVSNSLKILPVCVSPSGDEQDKDISLGIKYAVDNGAKVIIMTFTKNIVQREDWIIQAIKYANEKDVLIVLSAGNSSSNSDINKTFPNDFINDKEYVNNVLVVSGIKNSLDKELVSNFSNYGKESVDIFAPAENIYTTFRNNNYGYESGTSVAAPIVAGIAALIRSYYPNLTAAEVKQVIMKSGVSLDIMVNKPSTSKEKELVPFSSLSKSGKIVNAYNALLLAEEVSKKKKRKKRN